MWKSATAVWAAVMLGLAAAATAQPETLELHEGWALQSSAKIEAAGAALSQPGCAIEGWLPTSVPKTVLAALAENGVYPDPYYGTNLEDIPGYRDSGWLVMPQDSPFRDPWWYRTEFTAPAPFADKHVTLCFGGINFKANVWLNGTLIADAETMRGMFRRFEFDVTGAVKPGAVNALAVETIPPGLIPDKDYETKQIEATTGWDDHNPQPPDRNLGIWETVCLRAQGPAALRDSYVETDLETPSLDRARLTVSAFLRNLTDAPLDVRVEGSIGDIVFAKDATLPAAKETEVIFSPDEFAQLVVENPRVWWPNPVGDQPLYDLDLRVSAGGAISDAEHIRFGIRKIETFLNDEDWRHYRINGRDILIRGGAWMTSDMLLNLSEERYDALVRYAREANLNMLRSEGFSIRETETFYNLCDELGVMVTQQIFGRSIPDEELAIACIDDMMRRVRKHPSLVHFLAHDETFPTDSLDSAYRGLIEKYRVNRTYQPHSGTFVNATRKKTGGTRTGTRELWTYAGPSHYYLRKHDGAWGFAQSGGIGGILAARDSLRQMMPADQLWPPLETEAWSFHTVTQGGGYFDTILRNMEASYGEAADLDDFCNKVYAMNYNSARGMFEAYGRNKYRATGITTWKYDAAWPAALTWQYVDWYLRPTAAYFGAKKACEALHIQYAYDDDAVYVVNGFYAPFEELEAEAAVYDFDLKERLRESATVSIEADGVAKALALTFPDDLSATYFLKLTLRDAQGEVRSENIYWLSTSKDTPGVSGHSIKTGLFYTKPRSRADFTALATLPEVKLDSALETETRDGNCIATVTLTNNTPHLAFLVQPALTRDGIELGPTYWSDNCFAMLPGESKTLTAATPAAGLDGAAPALRVAGWNVKSE